MMTGALAFCGLFLAAILATSSRLLPPPIFHQLAPVICGAFVLGALISFALGYLRDRLCDSLDEERAE